jgi:two-component system sensor histidine kinase HydH
MKKILLSRHSRPLVALGALLAVACLASTWYINWLQNELAAAVRRDAVRQQITGELQLQLRHLRVRSVVFAAEPTPGRREQVVEDIGNIEEALAATRVIADPDDAPRIEQITREFATYKTSLELNRIPSFSTIREIAHWSDARPVAPLLSECRDLADRQQERMDATLARSETQTAWAGRALLALGFVGALGGLLSGFATARAMTKRASELSIRVQAVQAELDQEIGSMTVQGTAPQADLDRQLDHVIDRVKTVCQRLQEQERDLLRAEQLAAVGRLAAGVAHEVRNPLTGIKFLVEGALRPMNPTPLGPDDLALIRQEIVRLERTVQGLLDFARTPPPDRRPHDLRDLVSEAVGVVRGRAEAKPITLRVRGSQDPMPAAVDRDQVISLVTNLLFNAIDAAPPGSEVVIQLGWQGDKLKVEVADSGPGIDAGIADRLFTPFTTTKPAGTGLGLAIARRIARDHGGTLTAGNRPEGGARFIFLLPASHAVEAPHAKTPGR